jgi:uncharacterized protein
MPILTTLFFASSVATNLMMIQPTIQLPAGVPAVKFGALVVTFTGQKTRKAIPLEVALDDTQQSRGLMYRPYMAQNSGMLFKDEKMALGAFWMKNTLIPLDIAFFDDKGKINDIMQMQPCITESCPVYQPKHPYIGSVEMNLNWFSRNGFKIGDKVEFDLKKIQ